MHLRLWISLGIGIGISLFWNDDILLPIKLLVVYVHEIGHGMTAMASGAYLQQINLNTSQWGETLVKELRPGTGFFMTVSAGYLGSILTGTILFNRGLNARLERFTLIVFLIVLIYTGFLFTEVGSTSFFVAIGWAFFLCIPLLLGQLASRFAILVLGVFFIWYCFFDLFDFTRQINQTDAGILAHYILQNEKQQFWTGSQEGLAQLISGFWTVCIIAIVLVGTIPSLMKKPVVATTSEKTCIDNEIETMQTKVGTPTPEDGLKNDLNVNPINNENRIQVDEELKQFEMTQKLQSNS